MWKIPKKENHSYYSHLKIKASILVSVIFLVGISLATLYFKFEIFQIEISQKEQVLSNLKEFLNSP
ncbi:hypothetical protein [Holzapfeliella floricola]|uniref:hypothetical protein n=1 Tax=Holzapfeliella floricola TaxID=679249 RepID=UPI000783BA15|nr:hypothetical protein [Holzapfeliella floricola]